MTIHELKTWNPYFTETWNGRKLFEVRYNDRDYQKGDYLELREYDPKINKYSGRIITCEVLYMLDNENFCKKDSVILSLRIIKCYKGDLLL